MKFPIGFHLQDDPDFILLITNGERIYGITPLTFGRARIVVGDKVFLDDGW